MLKKTKPLYINSLKEINHKYTTYFIDIAGVIYDGKKQFDNSIQAINYLLQNNKQIIFLSNNPYPSFFAENKLQAFGIIGNYYIVTSGDLLHYMLATTLADKKIYHLGRNRQHALLENTNTHITQSLSDADAVILSCFVEGNENHTLFDKDLNDIFIAKKPVYCPNPDQLALEGTILRYPSGYFAKKLEHLGCPVIYLGKPSQTIYEFISHKYPAINYNKNKTLMIGDTLETDIYGAINFGIDSLLILQGITGLYLNSSPRHLNQFSYKPTYIMQKLL